MRGDSRFGRLGVMTSTTDWSDRTDVPEPPQPNSPSRIIAGDDHIAECSDLFREAILARNRPSRGEKARGEKAGSGFSSSPVQRVERRNGASMLTASLPPKQLVRKVRSPRSTPPPSPTPSSAPFDSAPLEEPGEEVMETYNDLPQNQEEVPAVTKKPRIPPFFVSLKGDWRQLVALAKLIAPSFQSQMSGRFLKVTVTDDVDYRALSKWLESSGVEFKSFMLKQDRPVKVVIRGLPCNTEPEDIKSEIEAEGFKVLKSPK
ncbi:zinc finger protein [Trichonephila clavipes]|nr:zinc finger protein [Trichonephila clavipes]